LGGYGDREVWEGRKVNRFERIGRSKISGGRNFFSMSGRSTNFGA
jgi:hypothetical protein